MKRLLYIIAIISAMGLLTISCSTTSDLSGNYDSIYYQPEQNVSYQATESSTTEEQQMEAEGITIEKEADKRIPDYSQNGKLQEDKGYDQMTINNYYGSYTDRLNRFHTMDYYSPLRFSMGYSYGMYNSWSLGFGHHNRYSPYGSFNNSFGYGYQGFYSPYYGIGSAYYGMGYRHGYYNGYYNGSYYNDLYRYNDASSNYASTGPRRNKVTADGRRPSSVSGKESNKHVVTRNSQSSKVAGSGSKANIQPNGTVTRVNREGLISEDNKSNYNSGSRTKYIRSRVRGSGTKNSNYSSRQENQSNSIFERNKRAATRSSYTKPEQSYNRSSNSSYNRRSSSSSSGYRNRSSSSSNYSNSNSSNYSRSSGSNSGSYNKSSSGSSSSGNSSSGSVTRGRGKR